MDCEKLFFNFISIPIYQYYYFLTKNNVIWNKRFSCSNLGRLCFSKLHLEIVFDINIRFNTSYYVTFESFNKLYFKYSTKHEYRLMNNQ